MGAGLGMGVCGCGWVRLGAQFSNTLLCANNYRCNLEMMICYDIDLIKSLVKGRN